MIKRLKSLKKHSFSVFVATVVEGKPKGGDEDGDGARNDRQRQRKEELPTTKTCKPAEKSS